MKSCCICKKGKNESDFFKDSRSKDGLAGACRDCESARKVKYAQENLEHVRRQKREGMAKLRLKKREALPTNKTENGKRKCSKCEAVKDLDCFGKNKKGKGGLHFWCKECCKQYSKALKLRNPAAWERQREKNFIRQRILRGLDPNEPPRKAWPGSGYLTKDGYMTYKKKGHPCADKNGRCQEHHLVMFEYLRRPLKPGESVHHKNGIRNDNRIENLELWISKHPPGQRLADRISWCIEFLEEYGYTVHKKE